MNKKATDTKIQLQDGPMSYKGDGNIYLQIKNAEYKHRTTIFVIKLVSGLAASTFALVRIYLYLEHHNYL